MNFVLDVVINVVLVFVLIWQFLFCSVNRTLLLVDPLDSSFLDGFLLFLKGSKLDKETK